jgi:hypothetical protein
MTACDGVGQVMFLSGLLAAITLADCHRPARHIPMIGGQARRSA